MNQESVIKGKEMIEEVNDASPSSFRYLRNLHNER